MHKRKVSLIICALISLTLIGCSSSPKVITIKAEPIDPVPLILPDVDRIELENVKFYVVNEKNALATFEKLRENIINGNQEFAIDIEEFENLDGDVSESVKIRININGDDIVSIDSEEE